MMFASKTPEQAGFTPQPYRFYFSGKSMTEEQADVDNWPGSHNHIYRDVANQWYGLQSNPVNLVLAEYRKVDEDERREYAMEVAHLFWDIDHDLVAEDVTLLVDAEMVAHAHRVLKRLHGI